MPLLFSFIRAMLRWRGELISVARPWKLRSGRVGGGCPARRGPMATQCNMIDWGCQRCPAGRRRKATNKGLHRLAVTPPRQRRRHCWSTHQSTKEGWGALAFLIRGEAGRCAGTRCWMPPLISGRSPRLSLSPLPPRRPPPSKVPQTIRRLPSPVCTIKHKRIHHSSAALLPWALQGDPAVEN